MIRDLFRKYITNNSGIVAIVFVMALPMVIAVAGIATDLAVAYNAKARLMGALDNAALAVGSSSGTEAELQERMTNFFNANYPEDKLGSAFNITLTLTDNTITATASTRVHTLFMSVFGKEYIDISGVTEVVRELAGIEAVLVLDVTGSMSGSNIAALKTASTNFLDIMFSNITDPEWLKIGIVPYADSINVGSYGVGLNPDDSFYDTSFIDTPAVDDYVNPASSITWGVGSDDWQGCVLERPGQQMTDDDTPNWIMYRYPLMCIRNRWWGCAEWSTPNYSCVTAKLQPLTNVQSTLQNVIDNLPTSGNTYSHLGMVWGWRIISPEYPFSEGEAYEHQDWTKTVILMTDGNNTVDSRYSGEGVTGDAGVSSSVNDENEKLEEVCQNMKAAGVRIYTVTFQSNINETTKDYYRNCSTSTSMYFDAPSDQDLIDIFEDIANQLSRLHVTR